MVCESPRQRSLTINRRGTFFGDPFFRDSWSDYNSAVRRIVDRFNYGWISPSERIRDSQYHSMYRTLRSAKQNYSSHSARFREEVDCYKLIMDVQEYVGGDITVRTAGKTVSVRGKVEADLDGIASLRTEKGKQGEDSDASFNVSGKSSSSRTLHRRYTLPTEADFDKIESSLSKDAVLTVTIPKRTNVRYIPLTIEERGDKIELSTKKHHEDRNGGMKRPNDSPLLSSRKKPQEGQEFRGNVPWLSQCKDRNENKENSSAFTESVSARRSRFEKYLSNNSVDENQKEKTEMLKSHHQRKRQTDKYEDVREVTIPIMFTDEPQNKTFSFEKETKNISEIDSLEEILPTSKTNMSRSVRSPTICQKYLPEYQPMKTGDYGEKTFKARGLLGNNHVNRDISDKIQTVDDCIPQSSISEETKPHRSKQNKIPELKNVKSYSFDESSKQRNGTHNNKRGRSIDDVASSTNLITICDDNYCQKDIKNESSIKSPKLYHEEIPHLRLCKPEIYDDVSEMLINKVDNLKPATAAKLDTLDTPATQKNRSNSVTPGGREIFVKKRQSLMEEDIFQDCWNDFSNTLQEVLSRLQELSSELGQSNHLTKVLSEPPNEQKISVPGNHDYLDGEMKQTSTPTVQSEVIEENLKSDKSDKQNFNYNKNCLKNPTPNHLVTQQRLTANNGKLPLLTSGELVNNVISEKDKCWYSKNKHHSPSDNSCENSLLDYQNQEDNSENGQRIPIENQSNNEDTNYVIASPFITEPVLESKLNFTQTEIDDASVRLNVLQPQTSVDLVLEKDLSSTAVSQSSSVCLTDNSCTEDIANVRNTCNHFKPKLLSIERDTVNDNSYNAVLNNYNNDSDIIYSNDKNDNELIDNERKYKDINVKADINNTSNDILNDHNKSHVKYSERSKQKKYDHSEYKPHFKATESSEFNLSDCEIISSNKNEKCEGKTLNSSIDKCNEDIIGTVSSPGRKSRKDRYFYNLGNTCNTEEDTNSSRDCKDIVDIQNDDVMRQSAFSSQNGVNSPRGRSPHLSFAKSSARHLADLQKEKKSSQHQEYCNAKSNFADAEDMGSLLTRGKESHRRECKSETSSVATPVLSENTNPLRYSYKKDCHEEAAPIPPYVRQKSQPSKRFTGFSHVNSDNVRRMRDTWSTRQDTEESEASTPRNRSSPSPTRRTYTPRTCSPSREYQARCRSPSPMRSPVSPKDEPYSSFRRSSPFRHRQSFSPSRGDIECPMTSRDSYKKSTQKASYFSPTFSSSQKTCGSGNNKKPNGTYKCSSQDQKQFNKSSKKCDSPLLSHKHKENSETQNSFKFCSVPEKKRQSGNNSFNPKCEPSYSPQTHQRIFKRFRNANLQPDSEAICFKEEEENYRMVLDVDEFVPGEIEVLQDEGVLTVKGKFERKDGLHVSIRTFNRTFAIPRNSREEDIDSSLSEDGILTILVPKKKERIIKIELVD